MRLHIRYRVISHPWARTWDDAPTARQLNYLANQSFSDAVISSYHAEIAEHLSSIIGALFPDPYRA